MLRKGAFRSVLAVVGFVCILGLPSLSFAQDPGLQDSMIVGPLDRSVILAGLNMQITIPIYLRTDDSISYMHVPIATNDDYIVSREVGTFYPTLSLWDDISFLVPPNHDQPNIGYTSQSILGFAYLLDPRDPQNFLYTHYNWVHIADIRMTTTSNIEAQGDTTTLILGRSPVNGDLEMGLPDGATQVIPAVVFPKIYFPPNNPPVFSSPTPGTYQVNEQFGVNFVITATDPDTDSMVLTVNFGPTNYTFQQIQNIPGRISYRFNWVPGTGSSGSYPLSFIVNDGKGGVVPVNITLVVSPVGLSMDSLPAMPGGTVSIPVTLNNQGSFSSVGAFEVLASWNPEALSLNGVTRAGRTGSFEYFHVNRDDAGPGTVRIIGIADIRNGIVSPPMQPGVGPIFMLDMSVAPNEDLIGVDLPVVFLNADPTDNTLSDSTGYVLVHPDLTNGMLTVIGPEDVMLGDLNLNGLACEGGDIVLFVNHLANPSLFPFNPVQNAASDVNVDGLPGTVADLIYMINVFNGNIQLPKLDAGQELIALTTVYSDGVTQFMAQSSSAIGGVLFKIAHAPGQTLTPTATGAFTLAYNDDGTTLTVLAYLPNLPDGQVPPGTCNLFSVNGNFREADIVEPSASDVLGRLMETTVVPDAYELAQNYPNPFNATTKITFGLPQAAQVRLDIYNITGQKVRTLVDEYRQAGFYSLEWDGIDNNGKTVSSGTYLYRLTSGEDVRSMKMTLLK